MLPAGPGNRYPIPISQESDPKAPASLAPALMAFFRGCLRLRCGGLRCAGRYLRGWLFCRGWSLRRLRGLCGGPAFISDPSATLVQGLAQNGPGARCRCPSQSQFANHFLMVHEFLGQLQGNSQKGRMGILFCGRQRVLMRRPLETCQKLSARWTIGKKIQSQSCTL